MSLQRRIGYGVTLGCDVNQGTNYNTLGAVVNDIKFNPTKADVADTSILSDFWKQFAKGQVDPSEVDFEVAFDPGDNSGNSQTTAILKTLHAASGPNTYPFQLTLPAIASPGSNVAQTINFSAHLISLGIGIAKDKLVVAQVKLKLSGNPNF